jgi:hypothetical protein
VDEEEGDKTGKVYMQPCNATVEEKEWKQIIASKRRHLIAREKSDSFD